MAIIRSALAPRIRKKVGDVIFKRRLGQTIASQRALTWKKSNTVKQVAQRAKFAIAVKMAFYAKFFLASIFPLATYRGTKSNKFTKFLLKKIQDVAYPLTILTYPNFNGTFVGNGNAFNIVPLVITAVAGKKIAATWNPLAVPSGALNNGTMNMLVINLSQRQVSFEQGAVLFTAGTGEFFAVNSPLKQGDSVIAAIGQKSIYADGSTHFSVLSFQLVVVPVTVLV
jgi:hypothetical protein